MSQYAQVLAREQSWREAQLHFVERLAARFPMYRDVLQPLAISIYMVWGYPLTSTTLARCLAFTAIRSYYRYSEGFT